MDTKDTLSKFWLDELSAALARADKARSAKTIKAAQRRAQECRMALREFDTTAEDDTNEYGPSDETLDEAAEDDTNEYGPSDETLNDPAYA